MDEVGVFAIGPDAAALDLHGLGVPVERVCAEPVTPLDEDLDGLATELAPAFFEGADADRWLHLSRAERRDHTRILWATSQVASDDPARRAYGWRRALVLAWAGEDALVPALRALPADLTLTVLLGGHVEERDPAVRRNVTVLADLCRRGQVAAVIHNPDPSRVVDVALDAARVPTPLDYPRAPALDVGTRLGVQPVFVQPESEVPLFALVHVPLGMATQVPQLMRDLAARRALLGLVQGPPVDVEGVPVLDLDALRETLPGGPVFEPYRDRVLTALGSVRFKGEEPLVESIARALRPLGAEIEEIVRTASAIESHRILRMRAFRAAGIHYTAQRLRAQLDDVGGEGTPDGSVELLALLAGALPPTPAGVHPLAWRQVFAGVPAFVVRRGQPGWQVARELVMDRFSRFRAELASGIASALERTVRRALNPRTPLPPVALRELHDRALRVRDALDAVIADLDSQILAGCEIALRQDGLLRWGVDSAEALRERLEGLVERHVVAVELERAATVALTRRPMGMADPADFEHYLEEVVDAARGLARRASVVPDYESVLLSLLESRDPGELRSHLTEQEGIDPVLFIRRNTGPSLLAWFARTGMRVEVRDAEPCSVHWRAARELETPGAEAARRGTREHRLEDLVLPPPRGDDGRFLAGLAESAALVLVGLATGELGIRRMQDEGAVLLRDVGLPHTPILPFGGLHALAEDGTVRAALKTRVERRVSSLAASGDAAESLVKLVELATLGPSDGVRRQLGLDHVRLRPLTAVVDQLLVRYARRATVAMIEHLRADEVRALVAPPSRHGIVDLAHLALSGS